MEKDKLKKFIATTIREYLNESVHGSNIYHFTESLDSLLSISIREFFNENVQLADKEYFNTGLLNQDDKKVILNITHGDSYTKLITDFYSYLTKHYVWESTTSIIKRLYSLYNDVKTYNKNVFPIIGYDIIKPTNIYDLIFSLESRNKIIAELKKLPSIAIRNLKADIRQPRNGYELENYLHDLQYFTVYYSYLSNRDEKTQMKFANKLFKNNTTLKDLIRFTDEKSNFIGGVEITRDDIIKMSQSENFEVIYEQGNSMIVKVTSPDGIKAIGCNSLWCFTYGKGLDNAYSDWYRYSYNGIVYVLINFNENYDSEDFMYVLISPLTNDNGRLIKYDDNADNSPIYNMSNENYYSPYEILNGLFGDKTRKVIKNYLNFNN
jgi:hypothetical protein